MKTLTSRSTESALDGLSSTIFSGLSGGRTAKSEERILLLRSIPNGRSGCDHLLRFDFEELDLRNLFGVPSAVEVVSVEFRSKGESSLDSNGGSFNSACPMLSLPNVFSVTVREIADRPPIAIDFRRCCVTAGATEGVTVGVTGGGVSEDETEPLVDLGLAGGVE